MTSLPLPFITALLLVLLAASNHQQLKQTATGRIFAIVLYLNALTMVCIGLRWKLGMIGLLPIAAALTVASVAVLYLAFRSLGRTGPVVSLSRDWPHLTPLVLIVVITLIQPYWIEYVLVATKLIYATLLVYLAKKATSSLQFVRLNLFQNAKHTLWAAAALLFVSACVDIAIAIDFAHYDGQFSESLVGFTNLVIVFLLGWASVMAGRGKGIEDSATGDSTTPHTSNDKSDATSDTVDTSEHDARLHQQLSGLLIEQRLYADTELSLQKLSRKAGVPTRTVSRAINAQTGKNVSQWINSARIDAVCKLLENKDISITQAMMDAGFTTKSNFNREFRRLKGCSPTQWRIENSSTEN